MSWCSAAVCCSLREENSRLAGELSDARAQVRVLQLEARAAAEGASRSRDDLEESQERCLALVKEAAHQ